MIQLGSKVRLTQKEKDELDALLNAQGRVLGDVKSVDDYLDATVAALTPEALDICEQALAVTQKKFDLTDD